MSGVVRASANDILNQVGVEVGLDPATDPYSSSDKSYQQMKFLLNTGGEELCQLHEWDFLRKTFSITTVASQTGYDLPSDFLYFINSTGWDYTNDNPLSGPLTDQQWTALKALDVASGTSYYAYRIDGDQVQIYPEPPSGLDLRFEYICRTWVLDSSTGNTYIAKTESGGDIPLFSRLLLGRMVKVKFLEAKGFDTSKAQADFNQAFYSAIGRSRGAPVLNTVRCDRSSPLLSSSNLPTTGFGG